jgi:hypothetical protein
MRSRLGDVLLQQLRGDGNTILAVKGPELATELGSCSGHEGSANGFCSIRGDTAGSVERTTFPVGSATTTEGLEIGDGSDRSATHALMGVQNGLGAVQAFGGAAESSGRELDDGHWRILRGSENHGPSWRSGTVINAA